MTNRDFKRLVRRVAERRVIRVIKASNEGLNTIAKPGEGCRHLAHWRKVHTGAHAQNSRAPSRRERKTDVLATV